MTLGVHLVHRRWNTGVFEGSVRLPILSSGPFVPIHPDGRGA
jgi:hypothetical protein